MIKKKVISFAMIGVFTFGIGETGASLIAMSNRDNENSRHSVNNVTDISSQSRIQELEAKLKALGITLPEEGVDKEKYLENLDANTKKKLEEIANDLKAPKLSSDEALELRKQRINLPENENKQGISMNIDEKTKISAKDILEKVWNGSITIDEAIAELKRIGVKLTDQEIQDLHTFFNPEANSERIDLYNKLKEVKVTRDEALEDRINFSNHEEHDRAYNEK